MQCPVCGENMMENSLFCPNCSFEIHNMPDAAPQHVKDIEAMRVECAKRGYSIMMQKISLKDNEIARLKDEIQHSDSTAHTRVASLEKELKNYKDLNLQLKEQLKKAQEDYALAKQHSSNASEASVKQPLAYLLIMENHEVLYIFGINEGDNEFGTSPNSGNHRQLLLSQDMIMDRHFTVTASVATNSHGKRKATYSITPINGQIYRAEGTGNLLSGTEPLEINDTIYIGDYAFQLLNNKDNK